MHIAVVAHMRHPIRAPFMGGMEAHTALLVSGLQARGHDVTLFASGDSEVDAELVSVLDHHYAVDFPLVLTDNTAELNTYVDAAFAQVSRRLLDGNFDVVHNNSLHRYPPRLARVHRLPMVTSLHVPSFDALRRAVAESGAPWSRFTATSRQHARSYWPGELPQEAHVVHNGIDLAAWPFVANGDGSAVWAGRLAPNKGAHVAIAAARLANIPLTLFGVIEAPAYFDEHIKPFLNDSIRYGGHVTAPELARHMGRASVLVFTPLWDEPFGLVAAEAMACGLPVAAIDKGAAREVIGETVGRFADYVDVPALADAMHAAMLIPRHLARQRVETRFSIAQMLDGYESVYDAARAGLSSDTAGVTFPAIELEVAD